MGTRSWISWLAMFSILLCNLVESRPLRLKDYERSSKAMTSITKTLEDSWSTTCTSEAPLPADVAEALGCFNVEDLGKLIGAEISKLVASDLTPSSFTEIIDDIVTPLESVVASIVAASGISTHDNVCFGNWKASDLDFDRCGDMPLQQDSSFTVLSMSVHMPLTGICNELGTATFCVAVSLCPETNLPTVAINLGGVTLACSPDEIENVSGGVGTIASAAVDAVVDTVGFGLSLGQQFETDLYIYTALESSEAKLLTYNLQGMYYEQVVLDIAPTDWFGDNELPDFLSFGGSAVQTMAVDGLSSDSINDVFSSYRATYNSSGSIASAIGSSFLTFSEDVTLQYGIKIDLSMTINFSAMENRLGKILPDTGAIELAEAEAFMQTATTNTEVDGNTVALPAGSYVFAGIGAIEDAIDDLVDYMLQFVQSIINLAGDWLPFDISSPSDLIDKVMKSIDASSSSHDLGFGFAATEENVGLLLSLPLIFAELRYVRLECTFSWEEAELHCSVQTNLNAHFWIAIAEETEQGMLWLARESDETFDKVGNIIAAGLENATSEASAWAAENVIETISRVKTGEIDLDDDLKAELDDWATWGETLYGNLKEDVSEITTEAIHAASKYGDDAVQDAEGVWDSAESDFSDAAEGLEEDFGCEEGSILSALAGCSNCCAGISNTAKWLENAGDDVVKALESAWKAVTNFVEDAESFIFSDRSSYSYRSYDPKRYDSTYGCEELEIYKTEKEEIVGVVVDSSTEYVGTTIDSTCLQSLLTSTQTIQDRYSVMHAAQQAYDQTLLENANAVYGIDLTSAELVEAGFTCDSPVLTPDTSKPGQVPVTITCYSFSIDSRGQFSDTIVSVSLTQTIDLSEFGTSAAADVKKLQQAVADALASKITVGFKTGS